MLEVAESEPGGAQCGAVAGENAGDGVIRLQALREGIERWAFDKPEIESVWLVGSRAWGMPRPNSDFDFLVKVPTSIDLDGVTFDAWEEELACETGLVVHLMSDVVPFRERGRIPERDGILLYGRLSG